MKFFIALAFLMAFAAHAADPVTVFGLPLGYKLKAQPRMCPPAEEKSKEMCWIEKPSRDKSGRHGHVYLPNPDSRPTWAAYALFEASISLDGELERLKVRTLSAKNKHEIAQSISSRFGLPTETTLARNDASSAAWRRKDIYIYMLCDISEFCLVTFLSPRRQAEIEREQAIRRQTEATRPKSP